MKQSLWNVYSPVQVFANLTQNIEVDVAIIGGGITGITSANLLSRLGLKVCVLEAFLVGEGTTSHSTGNLYAVTDKRMHHIQSKFDEDTIKTVIRSRIAAMELIEQLIHNYNIECDYVRMPWYLFSESDNEPLLRQERDAAQAAGLKVEMVHSIPNMYPIAEAIKIEDQAQFNPAAYVKELALGIQSERCHIYANTPVSNIKTDDPFVLTTPYAKIHASKVILATHTPKGILGVQTSLGPYREYAIAATLKSNRYPEGILWSTNAEHHISVRSFKTASATHLIIVGEDHKVGQAENHQEYYEQLIKYAKIKFDIQSVDYQWSAQHYKAADGLPYIGETIDKGIYMATGFSTDGLVYGTLGAMIISDLIYGKQNKWASTYDSKRFTPIASAKSFVKENINVLGEYIRDYVGTYDKLLSQVQPGEGKVIEQDKEKLAVFRDDKGELHAVSAVCPHLKCIVHWNNAEKTWDCPCHGSRFKSTGEVIEGPAWHPLVVKTLKR
jgi:glycine/D-amino acid oxidase-like deaminating enzyme/nitrite reductase/ring-hydroxylating ferredoxin subunit